MTPILSRESRKRKRRLHAQATKALRDLEKAMRGIREFAEDHESLWRHNEQDLVIVDCIKYEFGTIDIRAWARSEHCIDGVLHLFNTLSEDK